MKKRVTIKDIAAEAKCSANCVSRALMDAPDISQKRKDEIRKIADRMGYIVNRSAAALRGRSNVVAIMVDSFIEPRYFVMINFFWERFSKEGYTSIVFRFDGIQFDVDLAEQLISAGVTGAIAFSPPTVQAQTLLDKNKIPVVVIGRDAGGRCDNVLLDDALGGKLAANHFLSRGFGKPMYLGETCALDYSVRRGQGFLEEFQAHGMSANVVSRDEIENGDFTAFLEGLCRADDLPDCIFCFSDFIAYMAIRELHRLGKSVPVIGFDNIQKDIVMPIALTSISYDKRAVANVAIDLLYDAIQKQREKRTVVFSDLQLVLGEEF